MHPELASESGWGYFSTSGQQSALSFHSTHSPDVTPYLQSGSYLDSTPALHFSRPEPPSQIRPLQSRFALISHPARLLMNDINMQEGGRALQLETANGRTGGGGHTAGEKRRARPFYSGRRPGAAQATEAMWHSARWPLHARHHTNRAPLHSGTAFGARFACSRGGSLCLQHLRRGGPAPLRPRTVALHAVDMICKEGGVQRSSANLPSQKKTGLFRRAGGLVSKRARNSFKQTPGDPPTAGLFSFIRLPFFLGPISVAVNADVTFAPLPLTIDLLCLAQLLSALREERDPVVARDLPTL